MQTARLRQEYDTIAPDGSEVRLLVDATRGALNHFTLPPRTVSQAITHRTIEEVWYFLEGTGQFWRKQDELEETIDVGPGVCLDIPVGVHFQFRNTGDGPLRFIIATMPPWPGDDEAIPVAGPWRTDT